MFTHYISNFNFFSIFSSIFLVTHNTILWTKPWSKSWKPWTRSRCGHFHWLNFLFLYSHRVITKTTANCYLLPLSCRCCFAIAQQHQHDRAPKHNKYHAQLFHSTNRWVDDRYIIFTMSLPKESNVFDLTDMDEQSAWSIKQKK